MLSGLLAYASCIGSMCVTHNYWSNHITSMAYVKDVFVPYCKATIERLRAADPTSSAPFGEQAALFYTYIKQGSTILAACPAIYPPHAPALCHPAPMSRYLPPLGMCPRGRRVVGLARPPLP